jgi:hypothetical protein
MKLWVLLITIMAFANITFGQEETKKSFDLLKSLEGSWESAVTTDPPQPQMQGKIAQVSMRVTSMGNAIIHEMKTEGLPDNPITMLYMDGSDLLLTHYCDAGNRPRMSGKMSPDGKTVEFDFLDVAGPLKHGHMHKALFKVVDPDHHIQEWTYMLPGDKPVRAQLELKRKK